MRSLTLSSILLALTVLVGGCSTGGDTMIDGAASIEYVGTSGHAARSGCPGAWADLSQVVLVCAEGYSLEVREYGDATCGRCMRENNGNHGGGNQGNGNGNGGDTCMVTGCSGQVCADEPVFTTCEWRPEYGCYSQYGNCGNFAGGNACGWEQTPELLDCLDEAGVPTLP